MSRNASVDVLAALLARRAVAAAAAAPAPRTITGVVSDSSGSPSRAPPFASSTKPPARRRRPSATRRAPIGRRRSRRPLPRRGHARRLRDRRCARWRSRPAQTAAVDVTLIPARLTEGGRRHRPARRGSRAGGADSALGRRAATLVGRRRRLQRQPPQGADPDRPVLFDQPAQLGRSTSADSARRSG